MITRTLTLCLVVLMVAGVAQAAVTHDYVPGKVGSTTTAGQVNDTTSLLIGSLSGSDLLTGLEGVLDPPIGTDPVHTSTITALDLTDGEFYGTGGVPGANSSGGNGLYLVNNGSASITYTLPQAEDIGKISIFTSQPWHGDVDVEVWVDTGSGYSLLYDTGFLSPDPREWGEHRLDILDDTSLTVPLATGVVGLRIVFDASQCGDWNYIWEIDAHPVPLVVAEPTAVEVAEGGAAGTVTITLDQQPTADVTITATPSGANTFDYALNAADPNDPVDLVFTSANWAAKTLTITAVDDFEVEAALEEDLVALSISTSDPCYVDYPLPDIAVDILDNDAGATHEHVQGRLGRVDDSTSLFFPIGQPSAGDLLEGKVAVSDPLPGTKPVYSGSLTSDVTDGELHGDEAGPLRNNTQVGNAWVLMNNEDPYWVASLTYSGLGGIDISKISIYHGDYWTGDIEVEVYADNGSGYSLLYAPGFLNAPPGEHRLDILSLGGPMQPLATGVVGLKFVFDTEQVDFDSWVFVWEIDVFGVPTVQATESDESTAVVEGGATDSIEFELLAEPAADVTVDFTVDAAQLTVTPNPLVIPKADWSTPLSVTVEAVDDAVLEGDPHSSPLAWTIDDADPNTGGAWVEIGENDCGAWGYSAMDYDTDCDVDLADLAVFAAQYLVCTRPNDPACVDLR